MNTDKIIESAILNNYVHSKVRFDNVKDTQDLITAAEESRKVLQSVVEYSFRERLDELVIGRIEDMLQDSHGCILRIGGKIYRVEPLEETA